MTIELRFTGGETAYFLESNEIKEATIIGFDCYCSAASPMYSWGCGVSPIETTYIFLDGKKREDGQLFTSPEELTQHLLDKLT